MKENRASEAERSQKKKDTQQEKVYKTNDSLGERKRIEINKASESEKQRTI